MPRKWLYAIQLLVPRGSTEIATSALPPGFAIALMGLLFGLSVCPSRGAAEQPVRDRPEVPVDAPAVSPRDVTLVIPSHASAHRRSTADLLAEYWFRSTGVRPIVSATGSGSMSIHIGGSAFVDSLGLGLDGLADDGFVLKGIDERTYVITGPTEYGTEFGVCEFLERYLGVRWLLPGEHGTDVPRRSSIRIPREEIRHQPAFFSRLLSGLVGTEQREWARRLRMHGHVSFHHNLFRLFPPSRYAARHPEFFPIINGRRYIPHSDQDQNWQPNFEADAIVDEATQNIQRFFRTHPQATSYSLGINDSQLIHESEPGAGSTPSTLNYLGLSSLSDIYYPWCNAVADGVLEHFPDKWFGCLAYNNVAEPPTRGRLHPRIIPFMTFDRMRWLDPAQRQFGHELTKRWQSTASVLGWYDYIYGAPYCLPRFYPHLMQEYLQFGSQYGVDAHYAEAYPNWGEGPKLYLHLKLLWDPDLDVDATLSEWYIRCVGPDAAPSLAEYFAIWERFWTETIPQTEWFRGGGQYLPFSSPEYLAALDDSDIRRCRSLIETCVDATQTPDQRARAELLRTAFEYYETSHWAYGALGVSLQRVLSTEGEALAAIDDDVVRLSAADRRVRFVGRHEQDPALTASLGWERFPSLRGDDWCSGLLWPMVDWMKRSDRVRARIQELVDFDVPTVRERVEAMLLLADGELETGQRALNTSFEHGLAPWRTWVKNLEGSMQRTTTMAHTGVGSVLCIGVKRGGPFQKVPLEPGRYLATAYAFVPQTQSSNGTVSITATLLDAEEKNIETPSTRVRPTPGNWTPIYCEIRLPFKHQGRRVFQARLIAVVDGFGPGERVYLDDVKLYRIPDVPGKRATPP